MRTIARTTRGALVVLLTGVVLVPVTGTIAHADPGKGNGKARSSSGASGDCGEYCSTRDGSPSRNGNGGGEAKGRPCAGCVGNADDKNPPGQYPNGSDANNGYECDGNSGIGRTNPAHTGCTQPAAAGVVDPEPETGGAEPDGGGNVTTPAAVSGALVGRVGAQARAEAPAAATGVVPNVLGTRLERSASGPGAAGSTGGLPRTGGTTAELLLAAVALLGTGVLVTRAGSAGA